MADRAMCSSLIHKPLLEVMIRKDLQTSIACNRKILIIKKNLVLGQKSVNSGFKDVESKKTIRFVTLQARFCSSCSEVILEMLEIFKYKHSFLSYHFCSSCAMGFHPQLGTFSVQQIAGTVEFSQRMPPSLLQSRMRRRIFANR